MVAQAGTKFGSKCTPRWWLNYIDAKASHRFVLRSVLICELAIVHAAEQLLASNPTSAKTLWAVPVTRTRCSFSVVQPILDCLDNRLLQWVFCRKGEISERLGDAVYSVTTSDRSCGNTKLRAIFSPTDGIQQLMHRVRQPYTGPYR